jgi:BirA family transcriptional regulator, biotin operon repressor / biotin---[acetyl-CoA-carboxylase] ligase
LSQALSHSSVAGPHWGPLRSAYTFHFSQIIDSTNLEARRAFQRGAPEFSVFLAEEQTEGRGSHGRSWHSPAGSGLYLSVLLKPQFGLEECLNLTRIGALAVYDAMVCLLSSRIGNNGLMPLVKIKAPNDVLLNSRKVSGILVESASAGDQVLFAVVGIGINVHHTTFPEGLAWPATSILIELGYRADRVELLYHVLTQFKSSYDDVLVHGFECLQARWNSLAGEMDDF